LANPINERREQAVNNVLNFLEFADFHSIPIAILHPHYYLMESPQKALDNSTESLRRIVTLKPERIELAIENLPDKRGSWIIDQLLTLFGGNTLGFCYDSSHENISGPPFHLLRKHHWRLTTCHLSDNNGGSDEHLVPGRGNIDWPKMKTYFDMVKGFENILFEVGTGEALSEPVEDYVRMTALKAIEIFGRLSEY
jgi:sugar phosphate isomerase/epimerase